MFTSMLIIAIREITAMFVGAFDMPNWLDNLYDKACAFLERIFFLR